MLSRYLALPAVLVELAWAASNSSSSISYSSGSSSSYSSYPASNASASLSESTSTITSFVTITAPGTAATGSGNPYANATGLEAASSCNQAKWDWVEDRGQAYASNTTFQTSTASVSYTVIRSGWIETYGPTEVYTLCDGYPRMNASTEYKTTETTPATTSWSTFVTETEVYTNISAPPCTIPPRECSILQSQYNSSSTAYWNYVSQTRTDWTGATTWPSVAYPTSPICGVPTRPSLTTTLAPAACMFNYATIQLLYWPVSTVGNHICGDNWTTVEATPTIPGQPNTAVGHNTTFTSPTVYMVMSGAYSVGENFETGTPINGILPMASDKVSSMCAYQGGEMGPPEPIDYADFDAPIPKSKYLCQPACWTKPDYPQSWQNSAYNITATENLCSTIYDRVYRPALQVPIAEFNSYYSEFTNGVGLDFNGMQCSFSPATDGIFYDPPSALQQVQSAVGPTAPTVPGPTTPPGSNPETTPAAPGPTVPTALPQTTDGDSEPPQPTQPNNPDPSDGDDGDDPPNSSDPGDDNNGGGNNGGDNGENDGGNDGGSNGGSNGGNNGGSNDGNDGGGNGGDNGGDPDSPSNPTPTQNVGGIIASIIGADPATVGQTSSPQNPSNPSGSSGDPSDPSSSNGDPPSNGNPSSNNDPSSNGDPSSNNDPSSNDDPSTSPVSGSDSSDPQPQPVLITDSTGATITALQSADGALILPSTTLAPGQQTSIAGLGTISVGPDGIAQNGQSVALAPSAGAESSDVYIVDGHTYTAVPSSDAVVVAPGVTLTAGGSATVVDGTTFSLAPSASGRGGDLVVDGVTATQTSVEGEGTASMSFGVPQQTGNAASEVSVHEVQVAIAMGVAIMFVGLV